jgi:hypothetical protein
MSASLSIALRNRIINEITGFVTSTQWLASSTSSSLKLYSGSAPGVENAVTGTLLATIPLFASSTSLMAGSNNGISPLAAEIVNNATATGVVGYVRWFDSSNVGCIELTVGLTGSGADIILSTLSLTSGVAFNLIACSVKLPLTLGTVKLNSALADAIVDRVVRNIGTMPGLGASGNIMVYSGAAPASAEETATGTLLANFPTGTSAFLTASGAVGNLAASLSVNASATGTAGYARWVKGSYVMQLSVGTAATDVILSTTSLTSGVSVSITDMSVSI